MNNAYKYLLAGLALVILSACSKAPSCSDTDSIALVKQIYQETYNKRMDGLSEKATKPYNDWFKKLPLTVESITNDGKNTETGKQMCSATLTLTVPAETLAPVPKELLGAWTAWSKGVVEISGNRFTMPASYVLQRTEDTKVLTASLTAPSPLIEVFIHFVSADIKYGSSQTPTPSAAPVVSEASQTTNIASTSVTPDMPSIVQFVGKHPSDVLRDKFVEVKLKALLTSNYPQFVENLSVASELKDEGDYVYGSGLAPHGGGSDEAGFAIHKKTGAVYAVMLVDGKDVKWFGPTAVAKDFPSPLRKWLEDKGVKL